MSHHRSIVNSFFPGLVLILLLGFSTTVNAQDGKALFSQKCASCHAPNKVLIGPALAGVEERWPDKTKLYAWIHNSASVVKSGYPRAVEVYNQFNKIQMTAFPELTEKDIDAILAYVNTPPTATGGGTTGTPVVNPADAASQANDSALIFGILTLILAVIALILLQVNSNLKKLSDEREGMPASEPVPFYRNKAYIALAAIILFMIGGYLVFQGAQGLGRSQKYQPEQPIYYSHQVHAGINQISCLILPWRGHGGQAGQHPFRKYLYELPYGHQRVCERPETLPRRR